MKRRQAIINIALTGVALILVGALLFLPSDGRDLTGRSTSDEISSRRVGAPSSVRSSPGDEKAYDVIGKQDLFRPERKPYFSPTPQPTARPEEPTPTPEGTPLPPPKGLKLTGVLKIGRKRVALISESSIEQGKPQAYSVGDPLLEYMVARIASEQVTLTRDGSDPIPLELRDFTARASAPSQPASEAADRRGGMRAAPSTGDVPLSRGVRRPNMSEEEQEEMRKNPFPFLREALQRAREEAQERGVEVPDVEDLPDIPPFLQELGAGGGDDEEPFEEEFDE